MHELALMESLVETVADNVGDAKVTAVRLEVGRLAAVVPDSLRFCFDVCVRGTPLEGAVLDIIEIGGRGRCGACGREMSVAHFACICACGSSDVSLLAGQELRIRDVEVI
jgi:hydrogenase nickel incorporation protein HypA/HybF